MWDRREDTHEDHASKMIMMMMTIIKALTQNPSSELVIIFNIQMALIKQKNN